MLFLNKNDIDSLVDYQELIEAVEKASILYDTGSFFMPDRLNYNYNDNSYIYMPCFSDSIGTKILTIYPDNSKFNKDIIQGVMLLNDPNTGEISCILDGASVTAYRTGAVGACGIKYTTSKNISSIGIIGAGVQSFYQILYASKIRSIEEVNIYDLSYDSSVILKDKLTNVDNSFNINIYKSSYDVVNNSEAIITTTFSNNPVLPNDIDLLRGKHFIGIGSYTPAMRELPDALYALLDKIFIDVDFAKKETGDIIFPLENNLIHENNIYTLGELIKNPKIDTNNTTLYKSVGMALFDVIVADTIYKKALAKNIGQTIEI